MINLHKARLRHTQEAARVTHRRDMWKTRLEKELNELEPLPNTTLHFPEPEEIAKFEVWMRVDDEESLWWGGLVRFKVTVPEEYPLAAPIVRCATEVLHPNIDDQHGYISLNILRRDWKPLYRLSDVLLGLHILFLQPNPNDYFNCQAAELMRTNPALHRNTVRSMMQSQSQSIASATKRYTGNVGIRRSALPRLG